MLVSGIRLCGASGEPGDKRGLQVERIGVEVVVSAGDAAEIEGATGRVSAQVAICETGMWKTGMEESGVG